MDSKLAEQVKLTRNKLRKRTLSAIFQEFDQKIMQLERGRREEKYLKMAGTPFSFFRGSAYLFYFDVTREWFAYHTPAGRPTWIQGDLHFENFGAFRNERGTLVYDVNDFDEGYLGSYLYDLLRMSVSIALVGRLKEQPLYKQLEAIESYLRAYSKQIRRFAKGKDDPGTYVMDIEQAGGPVKKLMKKLHKRKEQHFLEKVTALVREHRTFAHTDEIAEPTEEERAALLAAWPEYLDSLPEGRSYARSHFEIKDVAVKRGSGTASIGLDRFYVLIEAGAAEGEAQSEDDIVLEVKEVRVPVPAYFMPYDETFWGQFEHQGKRVTMTQRAMHHEADPYLGWLTIGERHFYVRERSPYKKRLKLEQLETVGDLLSVTESMGYLTAKMHARADADVAQGILGYHSEQEIAKAMGSDEEAFCSSIAGWAVSYAEQVENDYALFTDWLSGRKKHQDS